MVYTHKIIKVIITVHTLLQTGFYAQYPVFNRLCRCLTHSESVNATAIANATTIADKVLSCNSPDYLQHALSVKLLNWLRVGSECCSLPGNFKFCSVHIKSAITQLGSVGGWAEMIIHHSREMHGCLSE